MSKHVTTRDYDIVSLKYCIKQLDRRFIINTCKYLDIDYVLTPTTVTLCGARGLVHLAVNKFVERDIVTSRTGTDAFTGDVDSFLG